MGRRVPGGGVQPGRRGGVCPVQAETGHRLPYLYGTGTHQVLQELVRHDGFFSDAKYADLDDRGWKHHPADLAVGRIVGADPNDMLHFIESGRAPKAPNCHFVGASWAEMNFDEEYDVQGPLRRFGFNILYDGEGGDPIDLIDDWNDWDREDLVGAMQQGFSAMGYCGHGERNSISSPVGGGIGSGEIAAISRDGANLDENHPIFAFTACRVGFSLDGRSDGSMVNALAHEGASAVLASAGISWFQSSFWGVEYDAWSEVLPQIFWVRLLEDRYRRQVGLALRRARAEYDEGVWWEDEDEKTIMEFTLFGLPWAHLPRPPAGCAGRAAAMSSAEMTPVEPPLAPELGRPAIAPDGTYTVHTVVDASAYAVDATTIPGFHLLQVTGMRQSEDARMPVLPVRLLTITLPVDASVVGVDVVPGNDVVINGLNIPRPVPGIPMPGASRGGFEEVPADFGLYPTQVYTYHVAALPDAQQVNLYLMPAVYDPAADRATLHRSLDVTVRYAAAHPFVLRDLRPADSPLPADQPVVALATAMNVGDTAASLTPVLQLFDELGNPAGAWSGTPVNVPAGGSALISVASGGTLPVGNYRMRLELRRDAASVAQGTADVAVVGGQIADLTGPRYLRPGQVGAFTATFSNLLNRSATVILTLEIMDAYGIVFQQTASPGAVPPLGQVSATFPWTATVRGPLLVRALAQADGQQYGPFSRPLDVLSPVYLPLVLR